MYEEQEEQEEQGEQEGQQQEQEQEEDGSRRGAGGGRGTAGGQGPDEDETRTRTRTRTDEDEDEDDEEEQQWRRRAALHHQLNDHLCVAQHSHEDCTDSAPEMLLYGRLLLRKQNRMCAGSLTILPIDSKLRCSYGAAGRGGGRRWQEQGRPERL